MVDGLPPQIAPQAAVESLARVVDPDHLEVESLARAADLDLVVHHQVTMVGSEMDTKVITVYHHKHQSYTAT